MLKILRFTTADVNRCYDILVTDKRDAERQIWVRFSRTDNALHSNFGFDWGESNTVILIDAELVLWSAHYVE